MAVEAVVTTPKEAEKVYRRRIKTVELFLMFKTWSYQGGVFQKATRLTEEMDKG